MPTRLPWLLVLLSAALLGLSAFAELRAREKQAQADHVAGQVRAAAGAWLTGAAVSADELAQLDRKRELAFSASRWRRVSVLGFAGAATALFSALVARAILGMWRSIQVGRP